MNDDPWVTLLRVLNQFAPLVAFAISISVVIYFVFVVLLGSKAKSKSLENGPANTLPAPQTAADFGQLLGPSYAVMASLFGLVFGILISLLGGFRAEANAGSLTASVVAAVGLAIAVAGSLFVESGAIPLRRPIGAVAFLTTFVVAGLYWSARMP
jgi:hypothetical protein